MARGTVLVVEDDFLVLDVMQSFLEDAGYSVVPVHAGEQAREVLMLRAEEFCAVVTDIQLGGAADGWAVGRWARGAAPGIGIVYASGDSEHVWRQNGVPESVMLPKPFTGAELVAAVEKTCKPREAA